MNNTRLILTTCAALLVCASAQAQVTFNSVRIAAKDTVAVATFYEAAFGMQEVNRIDVPGGPEVFVNFGATVEAAKANKGGPVVIQHRDAVRADADALRPEHQRRPSPTTPVLAEDRR